MPIPLRKYGIDLHRKMRGFDLKFARDVRQLFLGLEDQFKGTSYRVIDDILGGGQPSMDQWKAKQRTYLGYYRTQVDAVYTQLAKRVEVHQRQGFFFGFTEFRKIIDKLYPKKYRRFKESINFYKIISSGVFGDTSWVVPEIALPDIFDKPARLSCTQVPPKRVREEDLQVNFVFRGEVNDSFKQFLSDQLDTGKPPGSLIKTYAPNHVQLIQREVLLTINQGLSHGHTRDRLIANLARNVTDPKIRSTMEYNVMRIARTSYQQAVNAEMSDWCESNEPMVAEMERVADGRPCMACSVLDGKRYPVGAKLEDHPNGQCILIPVMKTPTEMGLDIPPGLENKVWASQKREYPTMMQRFGKLSKDEKRRVFGNDALFNWWWSRRSKIKIANLVVHRDGMVGLMSLRQAIAKFGSKTEKRALQGKLTPEEG